MIKKILCLGLILILFLHTNYLAVYYTLFAINNAELTESCCKKIVINCNAHCYLDQKMNEQDDKNNKGTSAEIKLKITDYLLTDYLENLYPGNLNEIYSIDKFKQVQDFYSDIDHPPQL